MTVLDLSQVLLGIGTEFAMFRMQDFAGSCSRRVRQW